MKWNVIDIFSNHSLDFFHFRLSISNILQLTFMIYIIKKKITNRQPQEKRWDFCVEWQGKETNIKKNFTKNKNNFYKTSYCWRSIFFMQMWLNCIQKQFYLMYDNVFLFIICEFYSVQHFVNEQLLHKQLHQIDYKTGVKGKKCTRLKLCQVKYK